jgi:hypothetical protein
MRGAVEQAGSGSAGWQQQQQQRRGGADLSSEQSLNKPSTHLCFGTQNSKPKGALIPDLF